MRASAPDPAQITGRELAIRLLGPPGVTVSEGDPATLPSRRSLWLLAILALRKGQPLERQRLAGLLWPDSPDSGALHNLRQTLAGLRRSLGTAGKYLATVSPRSIYLELTPEVWVDVLEFDTCAESESLTGLERAIDLYRGPLLGGCDEPFAIEERDLRERSFVAAAERVAAHFASLHDHRKAMEMLRRVIGVSPYRESAFRALMTSLAESGETGAALDLYRTLRLSLRRDLNAEPDPETKGIYRSIRSRLAERADGTRNPATHENRLPTPLTRLLGRKTEVREVCSLLERCRLVTLSGVGGVGKTRLAIAVAETAGDNFLDGARFVDLASLQDSGSVPLAIAAALDIPEQAGRLMLDTLADELRSREFLIVLDNCEHLIQGVGSALETLLSASPALHVLATSRQSIGVGGELVWRVPSLSVPEAEAAGSPDRTAYLMQSDSVRVFLDRSVRSPSTDTPTAAELEAIGSICRRLDGIPLAIELAAARTNVLSAVEIEARLEDRFTLLAGGSRSLARHQTLRAAIEWSWDLLTETERALLMRLCVFRGGWTLEAAEAVSIGDLDEASVLDIVANLVDRSLVIATRGPDGSRFSMLESIRQFTSERLQETECWDRTFDRHRDYFLGWAEEAKSKQNGPEETIWFKRLETEHDNLRSALSWSHSRRDREKALRMAVALGRFWDTHGHLNEGRALFEMTLALAQESTPPELIARAHLSVGWMATVQRDCTAAIDHFQEALRHFRGVKDEQTTAKVLNCLATATYYDGDTHAARAVFEETLGIFRRLGMKGDAAIVLNNLGDLSLQLGDCDAARVYLEQSIEEGGGIEDGSPERRGLTLCNLSVTDVRQGRFEEARKHAAHALRLFRDAAVVVTIPSALNQMALVGVCFEEWEHVAHLLGASEALAAAQGVPPADSRAEDRDEAIAVTRKALGSARYDIEAARGRRMTMAEAVVCALGGEGA